jgi:A-macroglobulin TED domain/Alpha-2-macroglobulin family/Carboxypeptidase regulatory-like domain/A-macroglobulin receptor binding domain/MG2 domain/Alpha-2-macroglobulin bait region domain
MKAYALLAAALIAACILIGQSNNQTAAATYGRGVLHLTIPYKLPRVGEGQLAVEVLNPEDESLGRIERRLVSYAQGTWHLDVKLAKPLASEDLVWHRLRYRFVYDGQKEAALEETQSISEILRMPVVHVLGQRSYLSGGQAAARVVVTDSKNEPLTGPASVRIELETAGQQPRTLFTGLLNRRGTEEAQFRLPSGLAGNSTLRYTVDTQLGSAEVVQPVRLGDKVSILLTTEKPIYQPGQAIHIRALALDRANHEARANRDLVFWVEDSRGNKVFKKVTRTDEFGIASAEFRLAEEVNLGTYHLHAQMDSGESANTNRAEIALNVERYVLPKFKVAFDFAGAEGKPPHGYRPGDHVKGVVRANYFFGKPVDGAEIMVKGTGMDVARFDAGSVAGKTDSDGAYRFDLRLPTFFAGRPLNHGAAQVLIEATVKDSAGHAETRGEPVTVSESPLIVTAVPEAGKLIPNLENQIFLVSSYADGKPAEANLIVHTPGNSDQRVTTDAAGVGVIRLRAEGEVKQLQIDGSDQEGNHVSTTVPLDSRPGSEQLLVRTQQAVYRAGDRITLQVFATKKQGSVYVDVVKEGQTVLTRDVDLTNGQAELALAATPDLAGTLDLNAYLFGQDARPISDHRLVFVQPADELKVEAVADAAAYKPGDDARIRFRVTNSRGEGVRAALGVQVVDEAVFALAEKQPGFAKVFFYLEQEAMKPRYEIHSIGMPDMVSQVQPVKLERQNLAARALFAATEMVNSNRFDTEVGRTMPATKYTEYYGRYYQQYLMEVRQLASSLSREYVQKPEDLVTVLAKVTASGAPEVRDAWGSSVRVERTEWDPAKQYRVISAGADRRFGTVDDLIAYLEVRSGDVVDRAQVGRPAGMAIRVEHDRGPFNGLAEIAGSVVDPAGAAVGGARVETRDLSTGNKRAGTVNAAGQFSLAGVPPGTYEITISAPGFQTISQKVAVKVQDRAVVAATLNVGAMAQAVTVAAIRPDLPMNGRFEALDGRVLGGIGGGFAGDVLRQGQMGPNAVPPPPPAPAMARPMFMASLGAATAKIAPAEIEPASRVRSYFPEALYINPEIVTDRDGRASIAVPLADSITTWRMALVASTAHGGLGSGTSSLKVFQDFFVDLDLPVTLTQGDRISIPVAVYNYSSASGNVNLKLQTGEWFRLVEDVPEKTLAVEAGRVGGSQFTLEAERIGKFKLTLAARLKGGAGNADIVVREIEVIPNGREQNLVFNGRMESSVMHQVNFPAGAIPEASKVIVRLYPGPLSQVIEGMDAILRMPGGCFEQTSSSTYPNVLALDYMKRSKKLTPEVHAKAEGFIANGYQRLLTFEVPGGGFSWFGQAPANKILTAYGLMEFYDMSQVHEVDPQVIARTQQWLAGQQQADGSWKPDTSFINEGATNRYNSDVVRITAYIAWALENTGYRGPAVEKARQFVEAHMGGKPDAYTLAVLANFATDYGKEREFTRRAIASLLDARTEQADQAWWTAEETGVFARGLSASVETTGLAVQALLKSGEASAVAEKALRYLAAKKDASGTWGTTQATIMALRALLLSTEKGSADVRGALEILLNGKTVEQLTLTADNNDLLHQFVLPGADAAANQVEIRFAGKGGLAYQVVGRYFMPWTERPEQEPLSIDVSYDRTRLAQDDIATATANIRNNLSKTANMVMIDLGIPPGFDLLSEDLQTYQEKSAQQKSGRMEKFNLTATQAILYFDSLAPGGRITLPFRLRAKYPIRARTLLSRVYEYYDPEVSSVARPVQLEVRKR